MSTKSVPPKHPLEASHTLAKQGIVVPYPLPLPTEDTNWKVQFEKPSEITLVGSWANKLSVKGKDGLPFDVDLAVEMPSSLFQEKDYLNGRFFHKRAFYLASLAAQLTAKKGGLKVTVSYDSQSNDPRLTKLVLNPPQGDSATDFTKLNARVCIIAVVSSDCPIPLHRLSPSHSNIRISSTSDDIHPPTPIYNTSILTCFSPRSHLLSSHNLASQSPAFADAITLLRIWANQRGYGSGTRPCVHGFQNKGPFWAGVLSAVILGDEPIQTTKSSRRKPLGKGLSSYQLFRAALDFLVKHDFASTPVCVKANEGHRFPPEEYKAHHAAVLVDTTSLVNLLADVPLGSVELLRHDARRTLEILDHSPISVDPFTDVFLKEQRDLFTRFDTILRVDLASIKPRNQPLAVTLDHGSPINAALASLASLLRYGLGDRTKAVAILHPSSSPRPLSQANPFDPDTIFIGLVQDQEHAFRLVDHGPAADDPDSSVAERFREFWGDKADLRRFQDGRIMQSVVWDVRTLDELAQVPSMVVKHIIERHFGIAGDNVQTWHSSFDLLLRLPQVVSSVIQSAKVPVGFKTAMGAFDQLVKSIRALDEQLPLAVMNISPSSEYLRYTSVFTPVAMSPALAMSLPPCARFTPAMDIIIEFEKSTRWPDDIRAVQKIKLAFFERMASCLMTSNPGLKAAIVVGDGPQNSELEDKSWLEIVTADGWAFAARIWHEREPTLLDRIIDNKSMLPHLAQAALQVPKGAKAQREAAEAKEFHTRRFIHQPRHHRAIAMLCHQFPAFAGTVRLVKRWFASHWLLGGQISAEAVEVICASIFVGDGRDVGEIESGASARTTVPGSKERGFAAVVEFLKDWKWEDGLFVPLYGAKQREESSEGDEEGSKKVTVVAGKTGVWTLSTAMDSRGHVWTGHGPDVLVAHRVRSLAKATWEAMQGMEHGTLDTKSLFVHPTQDYDFIIQLNPSVLPRYAQNVTPDQDVLLRRHQGKYANLPQSTSDDAGTEVRYNWDPARLFFEDLQRAYADTFKLFCDPLGGTQFGGVWIPNLRTPRQFRVLGNFSSIPSRLVKDSKDAGPKEKKGKEDALVGLNEDAVLSEIERIGNGLIQEIVVQVHE
ncbi:hypothetical protein HGRIS_006665 [Hohenbuehelia grisea]